MAGPDDDQRDGEGSPPPPPPWPPGAGQPGPPPPPPPPSAGAGQPPPPSGGLPAGGWGQRRAGIVPLHPLSLGDVVDVAFKLFRATAGAVMLAVAVVEGPVNLLIALPQLGTDPLDPFAPASGAQVALAVLGVVVSLLASPLVSGAVTWIAVQKERGIETTWQDAYRAAASRYLPLLGAMLLVVLLAVAGLAVLAIPLVLLGFVLLPLAIVVGVIAAIPLLLVVTALFYVVVPVVLLEGVGPWQGLTRSARLLRPRLWPTVAIVVVAGILIGIIGLVLSFGFSLVGLVLGPAGFVADAVGGTVASLVTVPVAANVALLVYLDARMRHEGFDIQVMTADLARGR